MSFVRAVSLQCSISQDTHAVMHPQHKHRHQHSASHPAASHHTEDNETSDPDSASFYDAHSVFDHDCFDDLLEEAIALVLLSPHANDAFTMLSCARSCRSLRRAVASLHLHITGSLRSTHWCNGSAPLWASVRSFGYLTTRPGVKERCSSQALQCVAVDALKLPSVSDHVDIGACLHSHSFLARERVARSAAGLLSHFTVCVAFQNPDGALLLLYFREHGIGLDELCDPARRGGVAFSRFIRGNELERQHRLKMIPRLERAPRPVKCAVPANKPVVAGVNVAARINLVAPEVLECVLPIWNTPVVARTYKWILGFAKDVSVEVCFLIESQTEDEMPEAVLCSCKLDSVSRSLATSVEPETSKALPQRYPR